jgi:hypothetical protein
MNLTSYVITRANIWRSNRRAVSILLSSEKADAKNGYYIKKHYINCVKKSITNTSVLFNLKGKAK